MCNIIICWLAMPRHYHCSLMYSLYMCFTFSHNLKFDEHVKNILTICNQRSYLLKCLKYQGLPSKELHTVFCALIVLHIWYALPAYMPKQVSFLSVTFCTTFSSSLIAPELQLSCVISCAEKLHLFRQAAAAVRWVKLMT